MLNINKNNLQNLLTRLNNTSPTLRMKSIVALTIASVLFAVCLAMKKVLGTPTPPDYVKDAMKLISTYCGMRKEEIAKNSFLEINKHKPTYVPFSHLEQLQAFVEFRMLNRKTPMPVSIKDNSSAQTATLRVELWFNTKDFKLEFDIEGDVNTETKTFKNLIKSCTSLAKKECEIYLQENNRSEKVKQPTQKIVDNTYYKDPYSYNLWSESSTDDEAKKAFLGCELKENNDFRKIYINIPLEHGKT